MRKSDLYRAILKLKPDWDIDQLVKMTKRSLGQLLSILQKEAKNK